MLERLKQGVWVLFSSLFIMLNVAAAQENRPNSQAEQVFGAMLNGAHAFNTVDANLRMDIYIGDKEYSAKGKYQEQRLVSPPPGDFQRSMYRLELVFAMDVPSVPGSEPNRLTIVCHPVQDRESGRIWKYTSIEGEKSVKFIKISKLEDAIKASKNISVGGTIAETPFCGGLAGTMKQLGRSYSFAGSPQSVVLSGKEKIAVWRISGTLQPAVWELLIPQFGGKDSKGNNPPHLPTDVEVYIGKENAFPYKVEYWNRPTADSTKRTLLNRMSFVDVSLNGEPLAEYKFSTFDNNELPQGVLSTEDSTPNVLQSLGISPI